MSLRLAIMQPYLFPYLGYYQLMNAVDKFILLDDVNFIKRGWINRNRILINGKDHLFSMPLEKASQYRKINCLRLANYPDWRTRFFKTLAHAYSRAPEYEPSLKMLQRALPPKANRLNEVLRTSLEVVCDFLGIQTVLESLAAQPRAVELKGADRILAICRELGTDEYINLPGAGKELYRAAMFTESGIHLHFLQPEAVTYPQFSNRFIPMLSILDVIMFNTKHKLYTLLQAFSFEARDREREKVLIGSSGLHIG